MLESVEWERNNKQVVDRPVKITRVEMGKKDGGVHAGGGQGNYWGMSPDLCEQTTISCIGLSNAILDFAKRYLFYNLAR